MPTLWTLAFWKAATERAVKTFAQTLAALLVADGTGLLDSQWIPRLSIAGMSALVSVLTSIGSDAATGEGPSLLNAETVGGARHAAKRDAPPSEPTGYGSGV